MQTLADELAGEGYDINVVIVNTINAESSVSSLAAKCTFPVLQDVASVGAFQMHDGGKDDIYIYREDGTLSVFLPYGGSTPTNLGSSGYGIVKQAIIDAF